jgi:hypothetical protein
VSRRRETATAPSIPARTEPTGARHQPPVAIAHASLVSSSSSLSNKGFGSGFASRAPRFGAQSFLGEATGRASALPGVGAYDVDRAYESSSAASGRGRYQPFHAPPSAPGVAFGASLAPAPADPRLSYPGPSAYLGPALTVADRGAAFPSRAQRPAFAASSARFAVVPGDPSAPAAAASTPGPGHFDTARPPGPVLPRSRTARVAAGAGSTAFRSTAARTAGFTTAPDVPGPGAYELPLRFPRPGPAPTAAATVLAVPRIATVHTRGNRALDVGVASPSFAPREEDRFGRALSPRRLPDPAPAPGYYDPAPQTLAFPPRPPQTARALAGAHAGAGAVAGAAASLQRGSAVFLSAVPTASAHIQKSDAPGPTTYSADPLAVSAPRSFRLATANTWAIG